MEQFVIFLTSHWILSSLFGVLLIALIITFVIQNHFGLPEVSADQAVQLMNHQDALILDVRGEALFAESHILHAENIPFAQFEKKWGTVQKYMQKPVILVCAVGQDSSKAAALLKQKGFGKLFVLKGGIQGWKGAGMPLIKK